jgi:hypothetical protein
VVEKIRALDREVKYMLNKAKITKPKVKVEPVKKDKKKANDNSTVIGDEPAAEESSPKGEEPKSEQEYVFPTDQDLAQEALHSSDTKTASAKDAENEGTDIRWGFKIEFLEEEFFSNFSFFEK